MNTIRGSLILPSCLFHPFSKQSRVGLGTENRYQYGTGSNTTGTYPDRNATQISVLHFGAWANYTRELSRYRRARVTLPKLRTELAINLLTEKIPKGKRSKVWLYFAQKDSNIATCSKCNK